MLPSCQRERVTAFPLEEIAKHSNQRVKSAVDRPHSRGGGQRRTIFVRFGQLQASTVAVFAAAPYIISCTHIVTNSNKQQKTCTDKKIKNKRQPTKNVFVYSHFLAFAFTVTRKGVLSAGHEPPPAPPSRFPLRHVSPITPNGFQHDVYAFRGRGGGGRGTTPPPDPSTLSMFCPGGTHAHASSPPPIPLAT